MMQFKKYNSIENSFRQPFLDQIIDMGFDQYQYVVQEKVHGANLSFWCDGEMIRVAKRTEWIHEGDRFYNYQPVLKRYKNKIFQLFNEIKKSFRELKGITLFGELFGGGYPHDDVKRDETAVVVQKGVYYAPWNDFYPFDIMINGENYLDVDRCNALFEQFDFCYAKTLFRGSLIDALQFNNTFITNIPRWLNLPELAENICEGVVIKPVKPLFLNGGSRVIIKNKNERWKENRGRYKLPQDQISDLGTELGEAIVDYVTENRFNNVVSKIGVVTPKDFGLLMKGFNRDIFEAFEKDYGEQFNTLEKIEQKRVKKKMNQSASRIIQNYLKELEG